MTTQPGEPQILRISPSGPPAGDETNPPLIGGTANPPDGSVQLGRMWIYNGSGTTAIDVPGSASGADIQGMSSLLVDMREGYNYDVQADVDVFGTLADENEHEYVVSVDGDDGTGTWPYTGLLRSQDNAIASTRYVWGDTQNDMRGRARTLNVTPVAPGAAPISKVRMQIQRIDADADVYMQYYPETTILQITEYK